MINAYLKAGIQNKFKEGYLVGLIVVKLIYFHLSSALKDISNKLIVINN